MGDLGDYWNEHRDYLRSKGISRGGHKRPATLVKFTKEHKALGFIKHTDWHWQIRVDGDPLDYWPSKGKWRWRGETHTGREQMMSLIKEVTDAQTV